MPNRTDLQSILILGQGSIVIGECDRFDDRDMQALRNGNGRCQR